MTRRLRWILLSLLVSGFPALAEPVRLVLSGLQGPLERNVRLYLDTLPAIEPHQFKLMRREIRQSVEQGLMALGYYQSTITIERNTSDLQQIDIHVVRGAPTVIQKLEINISGEASGDKAFQRLLEQLDIKQGQVLNQGLYEEVKDQLNDLALSRGYFDSHMSKHRIQISEDLKFANIDIQLESGQRYRFGEIRYGPMSPATRDLLQTMINIRPNSPFKAIELSRLNRDLSATGYFSQIDVRLLKSESKDFAVPVYVGVVPKIDHEIETGIGFSTDEKYRLSLGWKRPWWNEKGHSFSTEAKLSGVNSEVHSRYKIPAGDPLKEYYSLEAGYKKKQIKDTDSELLSASVHRWSRRTGSWDRDVFIRAEYEGYKQGVSDRGRKWLLIPGITFSDRKVEGGGNLDPAAGFSHQVKFEFSNDLWGSRADFAKVWLRTKWLKTVDRDHRFLARAEVGGMILDDITDVPPSLRFFTGGDQTVRGYSYESISPRDAAGKLTGGRYMAATSIEYNYEFIENWRFATFIDSGTATNNFHEKWKTGAGIGIRWVTPLGPLRVDLAHPVGDDDDKKGWRFHFSMGPEI
ncbi:autotransporter assembly complex protein TamA [Endozoicomonadaceae bacterium StTr2]